MARAVGWVIGTIEQFAKALGISTRTARRHALTGDIPGAVKTGTRWNIPMTTSQYAVGAGVSTRTARRRSVGTAATPTDPHIQSAMPSNLPKRRTVVPTTRGGRFVNAGRWPYQYQGDAWIRFLASGDIIHWFTGIIVSKTALTYTRLHGIIENEIRAAFHSSPIHVIRIGYVYARQA